MRLLRSITIILTTLSCLYAKGQERDLIHDYRFYKLFENTLDEPLPEEEVKDSIPELVAMRREPHLLDYNLSFVDASRRGFAYHKHRSRLLGIDVDRFYPTVANRLNLRGKRYFGISHNSDRSGSLTGNSEYSLDTLPMTRRSVGINYSSKVYSAGISGAFCDTLGHKWRLGLDIVARTGRDMHIAALFSNSLSLTAIATKEFRKGNSLSVALLFAPSERSTRRATTKEVFNLVGDNLYSPSWGYQNGKIRNANIQRELTPSLIASYDGKISKLTSFSLSFGATIGIERYSSLDWYNTMSPLPDNYRYLPSYFENDITANVVEQAWLNRDKRYTQIDFDRLIATNRLNGNSLYAIADRVERITRIQLATKFTTLMGKFTTLTYGLDIKYNNSRNYKQMRDLLGGNYTIDLDYYLRDDDTFGNYLQNNLEKPNRTVKEGDRFGYDYALRSTNASAFIALRYENKRLHGEVAAEIGYCTIRRKGFYRKALFPESSYGKSAPTEFAPFSLRASGSYRHNDNHSLSASIMAEGISPDAENLFLQTQYNNRRINTPQMQNIFGGEIEYRFVTSKINLRAALFGSISIDETQVRHIYDDIAGVYSDIVASQIDIARFGIEAELSARLARHWEAEVALCIGRYTYADNAKISIYSDIDNHTIANNITSYTKGLTVGNAPQIVASAAISYFNRGWSARVSATYAALRYVEPSFTRRTERVAYILPSPEAHTEAVNQERLNDAVSLDISLAKTLYLSKFDKRVYKSTVAPKFYDKFPRARLTFYIGANNLLGSKNMIRSGYEPSRLIRQRIANGEHFSPQANRYLYAYPRTYYASIRFAF